MAVRGKVGWRAASIVMMVMVAMAADQDYDILPADVPISMLARVTNSKGGAGASEEVRHVTPLGTVTGRREATVGAAPSNTHFYAFRGIPYAEPPVGSLRWAEPVDVVGPWPGAHLNATHYSHFCPQYDHDLERVMGMEDCLYLNVFTPYLPGSGEARSRAGPLPVFVFIHGGAYLRGSSSSHGPARLLVDDIVLITLNYRLGALGFLTTEDETLPGNYGMLDQVSALRWVQVNVAHFGGDPTRVTIGGFSAGSSSVHLHLLSPLSRGLFHRSIMMSGTADCLWAVQRQLKPYAVELAQRLGCPAAPSTALKSCLTNIPTNDLLKDQAAMHRYEFWPMPFTAVVDGGVRALPLLPGPLATLTPAPVPVIIGTVPNESLLFSGVVILMAEEPTNTTSVYQEAVPYVFAVWPEAGSLPPLRDLAEAFYFTNQAKTSLDTLLEQMTESLTDYLFSMCVWETAESLAKAGLPVYTYLYTHRDADTPTWAKPIYDRLRRLGATSPLLTEGLSHGDELVLLFSFQQAPGKLSQRDQTVSDFLTSMWSNFVATGKPQGSEGLTSRLPPWTPLEPGEPAAYYKISATPAMIYTPFRQKERNFWQKIMPKVSEMFTSASTQTQEKSHNSSSQCATQLLSSSCLLCKQT